MSLPSRIDRRHHALRNTVLVGLALAVLAAACSSSSHGQPPSAEPPGAEALGASESVAAPPTPPDPVATVVAPGSGSLPATFMCDGIALSIDAFDDVALLADNPLPPGAFDPLEEFLATGEGDFWPQDGYWVVDVAPDEYLLVHHDAETASMTMLGTKQQATGAWRATTISIGRPCELRTELPDGFGIVTWRVDPNAATDTTSFEVAATGQACSGGQPMGDRLAPPQVVETDTAVFVTLMAALPEGSQTCPGNPEESVRIELDEPLGNREVRDGLRSGQTLADLVPPSP